MDEEIEKIKKEKMKEWMEKRNMDPVIEVTDEDFDQKVLEQSKKVPVLVDFWAVWCAPCLSLGPVLEKLAKEYKGKFVLAKVNVGEHQSLAQKYGVMSIPNVKLFKDGKIAAEFVGAVPESAVREWLDKNL